MASDTLLNLIWIAVVVGALAVWFVTELRRKRPWACRTRFTRGVAVLAATVALFPCVSASDDLVSLRQLQAPWQVHAALSVSAPAKSNSTPSGYLARLLDVLESFRSSVATSLQLILACVALISFSSHFYSDLASPAATGRAPPRAQ